TTDPGCPIRTIDDAFTPAGRLGVGDHHDGQWSHWTVHIAPTGGVPGDSPLDGAADTGPVTVADVVRRAARLLPPPPPPPALAPPPRRLSPQLGVFVAGSPVPAGRGTAPPDPLGSLSGLRGLLRQAEVAGLVAAVEGLAALSRLPDVDQSPAASVVLGQLDEV